MHFALRSLLGFSLLSMLLAATTDAQEPPQIAANVPEIVDVPNVPRGVEVQARGPVHEAFATPTAEARPTQYVPKKPPAPIEEMPPDEKPDGDVLWIGGYWSWDDDRDDYLWVSGCWRVQPAGKEWVPGYWREQAGQWQWVPGFWTNGQEAQRPEVTYYPEPPPPPQLAPPGPPPEPDQFYAPGHWMWVGNHYVWRAGYWSRIRPGYVYISSHYRWSPFGFVFVPGYWDYHIARRGVIYAPVVIHAGYVGPRFVYTPYYAVTDTIVVDAFFVRPGHCHYYFGDYYGPRYARLGFECGFHYSRRHYDPIITYSRWEYRDSPGWFDVRLSVSLGRSSGRVPPPPRTLVQQINVVNVKNVNNVTINKTVINNNTNNVAATTVLAPAKNVLAAKGVKTVALDAGARTEAKDFAAARSTVVKQRQESEKIQPGSTAPTKPRTAALNLPPSGTAGKGAATLGSGKIDPSKLEPGKRAGDFKTPATIGTEPNFGKKPSLTTDRNDDPKERSKTVEGFKPSTGTKNKPLTPGATSETIRPMTPSVRPAPPTPTKRPAEDKKPADDKKKRS